MSNEKLTNGNMEVANTIIAQLGGNKFKVMTGSKNFRGDANSVTMDLTRNKLGAKWLTVRLEGDDTYTMIFQSFRKFEVKLKAEIKGIYCDMLQSIFTEQTGLYTSLGTMGK